MIHVVAVALCLFVAAEHVGFMVLEMFFWQKPLGMKIFKRSPEEARSSAVLAANQGLYNGLLAAGLAFAVWRSDVRFLELFLGSVVVAGVYGAVTASRSILVVQAMPALLALALVVAS